MFFLRLDFVFCFFFSISFSILCLYLGLVIQFYLKFHDELESIFAFFFSPLVIVIFRLPGWRRYSCGTKPLYKLLSNGIFSFFFFIFDSCFQIESITLSWLLKIAWIQFAILLVSRIAVTGKRLFLIFYNPPLLILCFFAGILQMFS